MRAIECKSSATYNPRYFDALNKIAASELGLDARAQAVVYGGELETSTDRGRYGAVRASRHMAGP